jgi:hypothetical protein
MRGPRRLVADDDPGLVCIDCSRPVLLDEYAQTVTCATPGCPAGRVDDAVWVRRYEDRHGPDPTVVVGLPRPVVQGRPLPWITPVTAGHPWWRLIHPDRLLACQSGWCCQLCGQAVGQDAVVLAAWRELVLSDAALHARCAKIAIGWCPELAMTSFEVIPVAPADVLADGEPLRIGDAHPGKRQDWQLRPR